MEFVVWLLHILVATAVIGLVLLQHGKGADMGAAFGGGSSGSLFGASGSANFLSRTTAILATLFFATSLGLAYFSGADRASAVAPVAGPAQTEKPASAPVAPQGAGDKAGAIPK